MFRENNLSRVSFLKLLTKKDLLDVFISLYLTEIWRLISSYKARQNNHEVLSIKITTKKFFKISCKFVDIFFSTYWRNIEIESTCFIRWELTYSYFFQYLSSSKLFNHKNPEIPWNLLWKVPKERLIIN